MKIRKLTHQFLLNYIIIFMIIIILGVLSVFIYTEYKYQQENKYMIDLYKFEDDYLNLGFNEAISRQEFQSKDSVMILSLDRTVIESYRGYKNVGQSFSEKEFQNYIYGINFDNIYVYYPEDSNYMYVIYTVFIEQDFSLIFGVFLFIIIVFIVALFAYAKYTSNQILQPIKQLVSGVQDIGKGNYETNMTYHASDEMNILKEEINNMASTIKTETDKRIKLEENRKQLIRDLSHDIRTPLTNILGYSEKLILESNQLTDDQQQSLEIIHKYGTSANILVNELFDLSKLELKEDDFKTNKIDFNEWLKQKLIEYVNEFENRNIDYDFNLLDKPLYTEINDLNIHRLFDNILLNTMKYNQENFSLYISLRKSSTSYKLTIADNGIGIADDLLDKVFQPMVRIEDSRNSNLGGSGLGLAIVKEIVEKHGWTIVLKPEIESYFGKGCTFIITIPK